MGREFGNDLFIYKQCEPIQQINKKIPSTVLGIDRDNTLNVDHKISGEMI